VYLDNVLIRTEAVQVNLTKSFQPPSGISYYTGYVYEENPVFVFRITTPLVLFRNVTITSDKNLQIKATCNVTVASNTCWNGSYSALSTDSYFALNSSDSLNSYFYFDSGNYKTVDINEGSLYVNEFHSNKVYSENVEIRNLSLAGTFSFDSTTNCFYKQYGDSFNCNISYGGGVVKTMSLTGYGGTIFTNGMYKCCVLHNAEILDINTSVWFDMLYDGNNCKIYNLLDAGFGWSITNVSNSSTILISCSGYNSNYTSFTFYYWKIF
jgi:hypothetical protein